MIEDMDLVCGGIVTGPQTIKESGEAIFDMVLALASGKRALSETHDDGNNEFVLWQIGAIT